ncbi:Hypothetical predicted protein [Octopus vulgaris]|uniref:Uncharacterized protein n=1 Tax=Octopus vulgaris TaxID=6645 RepID=A0AA36F842_OCTVU|nr:Hypothetical predicted protein [Octopus vulgaris]
MVSVMQYRPMGNRFKLKHCTTCNKLMHVNILCGPVLWICGMQLVIQLTRVFSTEQKNTQLDVLMFYIGKKADEFFCIVSEASVFTTSLTR